MFFFNSIDGMAFTYLDLTHVMNYYSYIISIRTVNVGIVPDNNSVDTFYCSEENRSLQM